MAGKAGRMANSARQPHRAEEKAPTSERPIGAQGFGLDKDQQKAIADLWAWQEQSLRSKIILGGPVT
ncbi:MAG: hypothetical protein WBE06_05450 [Phycisphaerae bacterium]